MRALGAVNVDPNWPVTQGQWSTLKAQYDLAVSAGAAWHLPIPRNTWEEQRALNASMGITPDVGYYLKNSAEMVSGFVANNPLVVVGGLGALAFLFLLKKR